MKSPLKPILYGLWITALVVAVAYLLDWLAFGGIYTGITYAFWSWQYQAAWSFWIPGLLFLVMFALVVLWSLRSYRCHDWDKTNRLEKQSFILSGVGIVLVVTVSIVVSYPVDGDRKMKVLEEAKVEKIDKPLVIQDRRRLPYVVAKTAADLRYNRPNYSLTDMHLVRDCSGKWVWSLIQTPKRNVMRQTGGVVQISAENPNAGPADVKIVTRKFLFGPHLKVRDSLLYRVRQQVGLSVSIPDVTGIIGCDGKPRLLAPVMGWQSADPARVRIQQGVALIEPDGKVRYYSLAQAARRPELASTGRLIAPQQALAVAEAYRYVNGRWNQSRGILGFIKKGDQRGRYDVLDTGDANPQPYLLQGADGRSYWVTMLRPYRSGKSLGAVLYTDTVTGRSRIWIAPRDKSGVGTSNLVGPDAAMGFSDIQTPYINTARLTPTEPRLFFSRDGKLSYIVSLATSNRRRVVAAVAVDSMSGEPVALFHYQRDPRAEQQLEEYLKTGKPPAGTQLQGQADTGLGTPSESAPADSKTEGLRLNLTATQLQALLDACRRDKRCRAQVLR